MRHHPLRHITPGPSPDIDPAWGVRRWHLPALAGLLTLFVLAGMFYVLSAGSRIHAVEIPLVDAAMEIKLEITLAHLRLDEMESGVHRGSLEAMRRHTDTARWYLEVMRDGLTPELSRQVRDNHLQVEEWDFVPMPDDTLKRHIRRALIRLDEFHDAAHAQVEAFRRGIRDGGHNQRIEGTYAALRITVDNMETALHRSINRRFAAFLHTQWTLLAGCLLLGTAAALLFHRFARRQEADFQSVLRANRRARENDRHLLSTLMRSIGEGVIATDRTGTVTVMNPAAKLVTGCVCENAVGCHVENVFRIQGGHGSSIGDVLMEVMVHERPVVLPDIRLSCCQNRAKPVEAMASPTVDADGYVTGMVLNFRETTQRKRMEEALRASEARLAHAQRVAHVGHWDWDIRTGALVWSDETYRIFGLAPGAIEATYDAFQEFVHPDDRDALRQAVQAAVENGAPYSIDHRIVLADGGERTVHEQGEVTRDERTGEPVRMLGTVQDISERKRLEAQLEALATTDSLTGLYNRRHFDLRIGEEFQRAVTYYDLPLSLLLLDVDRFKHINDTHGHPAGDAYLAALGGVIRRTLRAVDSAYRYGGEEIAVILPQTDRDGALVFARRLCRLAAELRVPHGQAVLATTVSIGVASPGGGAVTSVDALIQAADAALYRAKGEGRDRVAMHESGLAPDA